MAVKLKQGDSFKLPFSISFAGTAISIDDISTIEVYIGDIRKTYPEEITYNLVDGNFYIPLTQEDTFSFEVGSVLLDVRVKFVGDDTLGPLQTIPIIVMDAVSEVVL